MSEKLTHDYELCARGGRSRSALKMEAARNNLEKAKAALAAGFVGGRALARSFCSFRRAAPAFLLCIANPLVVRAEQLFERAEVTKTTNVVLLLPRNTKAVPGDVVTKRSVRSRQEGIHAPSWSSPTSRLPGLAPMRSSAFLQAREKSSLDGGTLLFSSPKGAGGGKVQAGAITAAVTGTDFLISNINKRVKVICLSGKVLVYFTANPKEGRGLKPGQMVDVAAGATKIPAATTINLTTLLATSMLGEAGGLGPFPNQAAIEKNARNQQDTSLLGGFLPGLNNLLTQPGSLPAQAMTTQAGQATRSITTANNIASQQLAAQQAAAQQAAAQQAAAQQAAAQQAAAQQAAAQQAAAQQAAALLETKEIAAIKATRVKATRVKATRVKATRVKATRRAIEATRVKATRVKATRDRATRVKATRVKATRVKATRVKATRVKATRDRATRDRARAIRDKPVARIDSGSK